jgi:site-specific recombinase XerD
MERQTVSQLADRVLAELRRQSYASITIKHLGQAFARFAKYAAKTGELFLSDKLTENYFRVVFDWKTSAVEKPSPHITSQLRAIRMLKVLENNGCIPGRIANPKEPPQCFMHYRDLYVSECIDRGLADRTIASRSLDICNMLIFVKNKGIEKIDEINVAVLDEYLVVRSGEAPSAMQRLLSSLRCFLRSMFSNSVISSDLSLFIPSRSKYPTKPVQKLWTVDEVNDLIGLVDRSDATGKRDYAILLLAAKYGIRTGDIVNLKLSDINWDTMALQFCQNKTSVPNVLPILDDIGWALADWITNARPKQARTNHVFTRLTAPYCAMQGIHSTLKRRMTIAGISTVGCGKSGPHSLRHALASNMLAGQVPLPVITSVLGHSSSASTNVYLHSDIEGLRQCAIDCPEEEGRS